MRYILILAVLVGSFAWASELKPPPDTDQYFACPRATLIAKSQGDSLVAELSQNYSHPTKEQPEPRFSSGLEFQNGAAVHWELVRRTEHGDVYLIITQRPNAKEVIKPVLFSGQTLNVLSTDDLTVEILPEPPKDSK